MARYEHLPLYRSVYDLNLYFFRLARGFPEDYKYGLAQDIGGLLTSLIDRVVKANNNKDETLATRV